MATTSTNTPIIAEQLAAAVARHRGRALPEAVRETCERMLVDIAGLCVAARGEGYVKATLDAWEASGASTVIGHARTLDAAGAAFVNGTAAHGEDYDDTFEGGPVHAGVVVVPALLAVTERERISGADLLYGLCVGAEVMCRGSMVAPKRIHQAGFHPTAVLGAMGAAAGVAAALRLDENTFASAQGIAGSMASGLIEYLAEGTSTKRMHPGWAAQSGLRAVALARAGFEGPRTVWEGAHGFLHGFAHTLEGRWDRLVEGFGKEWIMRTIALKPYACGTMIHPYIDCARRLAESGVTPERVREIVCETAEGIVHRLWEPMEVKHRPPTPYAAKFSIPYCVAYGLVHGAVGLDAFAEHHVRDARLLALASKVRYEIDPRNPYPDEYTGHVRVVLDDGRVVEERQPHLRGGAREPLTRAELERKFMDNCAYGGWPRERAGRWLAMARGAFEGGIDLKEFRA
jgi:2-methylcitrate dehydratase PrpD